MSTDLAERLVVMENRLEVLERELARPRRRKNLVHNGCFRVNQRASVGVANGARAYGWTDRWWAATAGGGALSIDAVDITGTASPEGNALRVYTSTVDASVAAGDYGYFGHVIEGLDARILRWGEADASPATLGMFVYCGKTGLHAVSIRNWATFNRSYIATFNVPVANTWQFVTLTIPPPPTGSFFARDDTGSIEISIPMWTGTTLQAPAANTWQTASYISVAGLASYAGSSGLTEQIRLAMVQFEPGSVSTSYEWLPVSQQMEICSRYFQAYDTVGASGNYGFFPGSGAIGVAGNATSNCMYSLPLRSPMRAAPTCTFSAASTFNVLSSVISAPAVTGITRATDGASKTAVRLDITAGSAFGNAGDAAVLRANNTTGAFIWCSAELA